ncbi:MAG: hypothetical protein JST91_18230 [Actinobacteria bacterium]|nr:hypothetical protein [Actinomycetota bacterium]
MPRAVTALLAAAVIAAATTVPAYADEPVLRHVTYTVTADSPVSADIYYRDTDPPTWADYSHNPYVFSPRAVVDVGPDTPWVLDVMLADPDRWAMVTASNGLSAVTPTFRCQLAVDGVVVASDDGPKGALCALRHW